LFLNTLPQVTDNGFNGHPLPPVSPLNRGFTLGAFLSLEFGLGSSKTIIQVDFTDDFNTGIYF
jgi:hypothetical protein